MASKYQTIADQLRVEIKAGKYITATTLPSEFDLCREFQVSRQTIRQALAVLTRDGLIKRRQGSGSQIIRKISAVQGQKRSVAVITTYISDYIFPSILREIEQVFAANDCSPILFSTQNQLDNERRILAELLDADLAGIIIEGSKSTLPNPNSDLFERLSARDIPIVFIHSTYPNLKQFPSVTDDNRSGGRMLVEYLYKKGHRNIAGIFKSDDAQGLRRYEGFSSALRDLELPMDDRWVFWYNTALKQQLISGQALEQTDAFLDACSAVVCYNDEIANALVSHWLKKGVAIPGDMAVVSFDNSHYSDLCPVPITSLSHAEHNVGRMAAEMLLGMMNGDPGRSEKAPWVLVEKHSS